MQGQGGVAVGRQAQGFAQGQLLGHGLVLEQGVDHDIADEKDFFLGHPFPLQVFIGDAIRGEQIVAQHVGAQAIDFLGHVHVPGAQARLDMGHLDSQLFSRDGAGHGGVDIPHHDDQIRLFPQADLFELDHDPGGLLGMGTATHFQIDIGLGHAEVVEEGFAHLLVVVLAGVDEEVLDFVRVSVHGLDDRGHFHEVGAGADDVEDFHDLFSFFTSDDISAECFSPAVSIRIPSIRAASTDRS